MAREVTCDRCGQVFIADRTDEEAMAECHRHFGKYVKKEDCDLLCKDCWEKIRPDKMILRN